MINQDLVPLLRASIEIAKAQKARKALKSARFNFQLARLELMRAVRDVERTMRQS